jgi:hypothetical protein
LYPVKRYVPIGINDSCGFEAKDIFNGLVRIRYFKFSEQGFTFVKGPLKPIVRNLLGG